MNRKPQDHYESFDSESPQPEIEDDDDYKLLMASIGILTPIMRQTLSVTERDGHSLPPEFDENQTASH